MFIWGPGSLSYSMNCGLDGKAVGIMLSELCNSHGVAPQRHRTLLVAESGSLIREVLKCWLEKIPAIEKVYAAASSEICLELALHTSPALVILPFRFDNESGVQVAKKLKDLCPEVKIAFWIGNVSDLLLCEILACDPIGLISLYDTPEHITEIIERLLDGISSHSDLLDERIQKIRRHLACSRRKDIIGLTNRQKEVLRYLAKGDTVKEVASKMHLSAKSIDSHKYRIMKKLEIHDRVHLTRFAIREGLLEA